MGVADLARVQRRRWRPAVVLQRVQLSLYRVLFVPVLAGRRAATPRSIAFLARRSVLMPRSREMEPIRPVGGLAARAGSRS